MMGDIEVKDEPVDNLGETMYTAADVGVPNVRSLLEGCVEVKKEDPSLPLNVWGIPGDQDNNPHRWEVTDGQSSVLLTEADIKTENENGQTSEALSPEWLSSPHIPASAAESTCDNVKTNNWANAISEPTSLHSHINQSNEKNTACEEDQAKKACCEYTSNEMGDAGISRDNLNMLKSQWIQQFNEAQSQPSLIGQPQLQVTRTATAVHAEYDVQAHDGPQHYRCPFNYEHNIFIPELACPASSKSEEPKGSESTGAIWKFVCPICVLNCDEICTSADRFWEHLDDHPCFLSWNVLCTCADSPRDSMAWLNKKHYVRLAAYKRHSEKHHKGTCATNAFLDVLFDPAMMEKMTKESSCFYSVEDFCHHLKGHLNIMKVTPVCRYMYCHSDGHIFDDASSKADMFMCGSQYLQHVSTRHVIRPQVTRPESMLFCIQMSLWPRGEQKPVSSQLLLSEEREGQEKEEQEQEEKDEQEQEEDDLVLPTCHEEGSQMVLPFIWCPFKESGCKFMTRDLLLLSKHVRVHLDASGRYWMTVCRVCFKLIPGMVSATDHLVKWHLESRLGNAVCELVDSHGTTTPEAELKGRLHLKPGEPEESKLPNYKLTRGCFELASSYLRVAGDKSMKVKPKLALDLAELGISVVVREESKSSGLTEFHVFETIKHNRDSFLNQKFLHSKEKHSQYISAIFIANSDLQMLAKPAWYAPDCPPKSLDHAEESSKKPKLSKELAEQLFREKLDYLDMKYLQTSKEKSDDVGTNLQGKAANPRVKKQKPAKVTNAKPLVSEPFNELERLVVKMTKSKATEQFLAKLTRVKKPNPQVDMACRPNKKRKINEYYKDGRLRSEVVHQNECPPSVSTTTAVSRGFRTNVQRCPNVNRTQYADVHTVLVGIDAGSFHSAPVVIKEMADMFIFQCPYCIFSRKNLPDVALHVTVLHSMDSLHCRLRVEKNKSSSIILYCRFCDFVTVDQLALWRHFQNVHRIRRRAIQLSSSTSWINAMIACCGCNFTTNSQSDFAQHMVGKHANNLNIFKLDHTVCHITVKEEVVQDADELCTDLESEHGEHGEHAPSKTTLGYQCLHCSEFHTSVKDIELHCVEEHNEDMVFFCMECDVNLSTLPSFAMHFELHKGLRCSAAMKSALEGEFKFAPSTDPDDLVEGINITKDEMSHGTVVSVCSEGQEAETSHCILCIQGVDVCLPVSSLHADLQAILYDNNNACVNIPIMNVGNAL